MKCRLLCLCLLGAALPAVAHHSFDAEYDGNKTIVLMGVVTKVEWMNPHARFYVDVKENDGSLTNWNLELGSPASLIRRGWNRKSLKVGDQITVKASFTLYGHSKYMYGTELFEYVCNENNQDVEHLVGKDSRNKYSKQ